MSILGPNNGQQPTQIPWMMANGKGGGPLKPYTGGMDPLAMAEQAQNMALYQQGQPGPISGPQATITRGAPMDFDALRASLMPQSGNNNGYGPKGDEHPGMDKGQPGGGGGQGGGGNQNAQFDKSAPFSWEQYATKPGVTPYDLDSIMNWAARQNQQDPNDKLDWGRIFRTGAGGRQNR